MNIGSKEMRSLVIMSMISSLVFLEPKMMISEPGQNTWMLPLIALPLSLVLLVSIRSLSLHYGDPHQSYTAVLGKGLGKGATALLALWMILISAVTTARITMVMSQYFFPRTFPYTIGALFLLGAVLLAMAAAPGIARTSRILVSIPLSMLVSMLLLNYNHYRLDRLLPIMGEGAGITLVMSLRMVVLSGALIMYWAWNKHHGADEKVYKTVKKSMIFGSVMISIAFLCMALNTHESAYEGITSMLYSVAANINLGRFVQRLGVVYYFCFLVGSVIIMAANLHVVADLGAKTVGVKDYRPLVGLAAIIVLAIATLYARGKIPWLLINYRKWMTPLLLLLTMVPAILGKMKRRKHEKKLAA